MTSVRRWVIVFSTLYLIAILFFNAYAIIFESGSGEVGPALVTTLLLGLPWIFASAPLFDLSPAPSAWVFWFTGISANLINWGLVTYLLFRATRNGRRVDKD